MKENTIQWNIGRYTFVETDRDMPRRKMVFVYFPEDGCTKHIRFDIWKNRTEAYALYFGKEICHRTLQEHEDIMALVDEFADTLLKA